VSYEGRDMADVTANILSALFGTLVGAALAWLVGRQQHKLTLTLEMHREFNSADMLGVRYRAGELLEKNHTLDLREMQAALGKTALLDVWRIIRFYERLWLAIKKRRVLRREIPGLFGEIFDWWYLQSFHRQLLPLGIRVSRDIEAMHDWILRRTTPPELESWRAGHLFWTAQRTEPGSTRPNGG
jgi:hypothetical protein